MNGHKSIFSFLRQNFIFIFFSVLVDPIIFLSILPQTFTNYLTALSWGIWLFVTIFFYSGLYGSFIDRALKQEVTVDFSTICDNAQLCWAPYLAVYLVPYLIHFLLFAIFSDGNIWMNMRVIRSISDAFVMLLSIVSILNLKRSCIKWHELIREIILSGRIAALAALAVMGVLIEVWFCCQKFTANKLWVDAEIIFVGRIFYFLLFAVFLNNINCLIEKNTSAGEDSQKLKKKIYFIEPKSLGIFQVLVTCLANRSGVFTIIKALSPDDYAVHDFSRITWFPEMFCSGKLVAITCFTSNCAEAYWIARQFKNAGSTVVMGGPHVMFVPEEALLFCDAVVIGDAEAIWPQLIRDYEQGALQKIYRGKRDSLNTNVVERILRLPRRDIRRVIQMGRGCKFHCDFCCISAMAAGNLQQQSVDETIKIIQTAVRPGGRISFLDNNIYADPERARELFRRMIPLRIKWHASCSIDLARHDDDLRLARQSGCQGLLIGYELTPTDVLEIQKGGKFIHAADYVKLTKKIHRIGIKVKAHFIFGFENQGWGALFSTWAVCLRLFPLAATLSMLTPFVGTKFFERIFQEERAVNLNWEKYSLFSMVFKHPHFSYQLVNLIFPVIHMVFFLTTNQLGWTFLLMFILMHRLHGV